MFKTFVAMTLFSLPLFANSDPLSAEDLISQKIITAYANMGEAAIQGPSEISLLDQAKLDLDQNYVFIPKKEATAYMKATGNGEDPNLIGLLLNAEGSTEWMISIQYNPEGYIRADDAKNWNADELLKQLTDNTEAANVERKEGGYGAIHVVNWIERPQYDNLNHRLVWSIEAKSDAAPYSEEPDYDRFVNYKTYAFGRYGFLEFTLMTDKATVDIHKIHADNVLKATDFNRGNRYTDFIEGHDRVAEYGLTALIVGAAAKKLGLFGIVGVFLLKMWKIVAVGVVFVFGAIRSFFGKKKEVLH